MTRKERYEYMCAAVKYMDENGNYSVAAMAYILGVRKEVISRYRARIIKNKWKKD